MLAFSLELAAPRPLRAGRTPDTVDSFSNSSCSSSKPAHGLLYARSRARGVRHCWEASSLVGQRIRFQLVSPSALAPGTSRVQRMTVAAASGGAPAVAEHEASEEAALRELRLYNTMSREKEVFRTIDPEGKRVRFYSCGPTVYNFAHIGNFRAFLTYDVLKRYLKYRGYEVTHVVNITDIDDKIIKRMQAEGTSLKELTGTYTEAFFADMRTLNIAPADVYPRATDHVPEMIAMVERLMERGHAYEKDGSVYFSVASFKGYGKLARLDFDGMQLGASVDADEYDKASPRDFVLWKSWKEADGEVCWPGSARFGRGRPGWHLECSCMSTKYLGDELDIHSGGVDLVFPHHENEIAQSEAATGRAPFARYWIHNGFVNINDEKMSKSLGNFVTVRDLVRRAEDARAFRYLVVSSQYRSTLSFSDDSMEAAAKTLRRLDALRASLAEVVAAGPAGDVGEAAQWVEATRRAFLRHMNDDLNTPRATAAIFELVGKAEQALRKGTLTMVGAGAVVGLLEDVDSVLGIFYEVPAEALATGPAVHSDFGETDGLDEATVREWERLIEERAAARKGKDFKRSDEIRDVFAAAGYVLLDSPTGTRWQRK